jgi:hypothetical protein
MAQIKRKTSLRLLGIEIVLKNSVIGTTEEHNYLLVFQMVSF